MNETLADIFERWLQGRINVCVDGLLSRIARLEEEKSRLANAVIRLEEKARTAEEFRVDDQITGLRCEYDTLRTLIKTETQNVNNLYQEVTAINCRITEVEDRLVEKAPDEQLTSFNERVIEQFNTEEFRDVVSHIVADVIENSDEVCTISDVYTFIRENVRVDLDVSRY